MRVAELKRRGHETVVYRRQLGRSFRFTFRKHFGNDVCGKEKERNERKFRALGERQLDRLSSVRSSVHPSTVFRLGGDHYRKVAEKDEVDGQPCATSRVNGALAVRYLQGAAGRRGVACRRDRSNTCRAASSPPAVGSCVGFQGGTAPRRSARSRSPRGITAPTWSLPNPLPASSVSSYRRRNPVPPAAPPPSLPSTSPALPVPAPTRLPPFVPGMENATRDQVKQSDFQRRKWKSKRVSRG